MKPKFKNCPLVRCSPNDYGAMFSVTTNMTYGKWQGEVTSQYCYYPNPIELRKIYISHKKVLLKLLEEENN